METTYDSIAKEETPFEPIPTEPPRARLAVSKHVIIILRAAHPRLPTLEGVQTSPLLWNGGVEPIPCVLAFPGGATAWDEQSP
jgi:hypothetical protein